MSIIFNTQQDWVNALKKCASYYTRYSAQYPYNCLFWTGEILYSDCLNLEKSLFNGRIRGRWVLAHGKSTCLTQVIVASTD